MLIEGNVLEGNDEPIEVVNPATEESEYVRHQAEHGTAPG